MGNIRVTGSIAVSQASIPSVPSLVDKYSLADPTGLIVRPLDPAVFPPIQSNLICRRLFGKGDAVDLSPGAVAWLDALRRATAR